MTLKKNQQMLGILEGMLLPLQRIQRLRQYGIQMEARFRSRNLQV
jgi:hypothetical protein